MTTSSPTRILVVDDNQDSAETLCSLLELLEYDARTAYDGDEAIRAAVEFQPHVLVMDIRMPRMDGYEAVAHIRSLVPGVLAIAMTGFCTAADRARALAAGFDEHLTKPVDFAALQAALAGAEARPAEAAEA